MDNEPTRISVVMPTYNGETYIERTLESVFMQSELPFEIIIVDDGSQDKTVDVIKKYMKSNLQAYDKIKIREQQNLGAGAARNTGIHYAEGNWIMFLDSDDLWEKDKIKIIKEVIEKNPGMNVVTHNEYEMAENDFEHRRLIRRNINYHENENLFLQVYQGNIFSTSCMTIRKDILLKAGGFDETLLSAQDYDLWIRVMQYGNIIYLKDALATYVVRKGNITGNTYRRYLCEMKICRKYAISLKEMLGEKEAEKVIKKRIFDIHKVEVYLALRNKQFLTFFRIGFRLPKEYLKCCADL